MSSSRKVKRQHARKARTLAQQKRAKRDEWLRTREASPEAKTFGTGMVAQLRNEMAEFRSVIRRGTETPGHYEAQR